MRLKRGNVIDLSDDSTNLAHAEEILRRDHSGCRILLVEDEPINQEIALAMLDDVGLVVDVAGDGVAALEMLAGNDYDLILMDMQMPKWMA
jgi:CheY-like chemotaxis protein